MNAETHFGLALYDLTPMLRLMLLGILIACAPLAWIWVRSKGQSVAQRLRLLTILTIFLAFDLTVLGALTRLTDSGLGCPDWPGCYGKVTPLGASANIAAEVAVMPDGPVTPTKAWIEMIHRYVASAVGVLILVLALVSWLERKRIAVHPMWPTVTLLWVSLQGAFGALTVTMKLFPAVVTLHLLGAMVLLALLQVQAVRYEQGARVFAPAARLRWCLWAGFAVLMLQIALGGWVSTNYAVLACTEFPQCQGQAWPLMNFQEGFEIWRHLGQTAQGTAISLPALTAIHVTHRLFALLVLGVLGWAAWLLHQQGQGASARWIAALLLAQWATGLSNVVLGWPLVAALAHNAGAAALVLVCVAALARMRVDEPARSSHTGVAA